MEIYNYNETVERYIGENVIGENIKGADIKRMIEDIISHNCQYVNESGKFISIHNGEYDKESKSRLVDGKRVELFENDEELDKACKMANIYEKIQNVKVKRKHLKQYVHPLQKKIITKWYVKRTLE